MQTVWSAPDLVAHRRLAGRALMWGATLLLTACTDSPPSGLNGIHSAVVAAAVAGAPDPTLLPVASGQPPNNVAYNALNVPAQPAGFSYQDPVSGVKIWKVTSSTVPAPNMGAGHDYADGSNQVSRGWGTNNNTHTILIRGDGMAYHLVDFTRGVGFANYRILPPAAQPIRDLAFTFSSVAGRERIAYVINGGQLKLFNTATMLVENTAPFPLTTTMFGWLQQDKNDEWFVGLVNNTSDPTRTIDTVFAWNSRTNQLNLQAVSWGMDEARLERDGRYVILTNGSQTIQLWDLSTNTLCAQQSAAPGAFFHNANLRGHWISSNPNGSAPFAQDRYEPSGCQIARLQILANDAGDGHKAGNWIQSDAELGSNLYRQWSFISGFNWWNPPWQSSLLWNEAIGLLRSDGSDTRFLAHHYSAQVPQFSYWSLPFAMPSPDGRVVIFNSNMNMGPSARYDLFVAEMPLSGSPATQNVVWTKLTNVTANGNTVTKTSGCEGCTDAGPISSQTITSGDGYVEFQFSANALYVAAGLSNGDTDNTRDDIDFNMDRLGTTAVEARRNATYLCETPFDPAAVFRVERVGNVVQYKKNGTVFCTSAVDPTAPLLLDTWIGSLNASITNAVISGLLN